MNKTHFPHSFIFLTLFSLKFCLIASGVSLSTHSPLGLITEMFWSNQWRCRYATFFYFFFFCNCKQSDFEVIVVVKKTWFLTMQSQSQSQSQVEKQRKWRTKKKPRLGYDCDVFLRLLLCGMEISSFSLPRQKAFQKRLSAPFRLWQ